MTHGLDVANLAVISACFIAWGLLSARLERVNISAPIAFVVLGLVVTHGPTTLIHLNLHSSAIRTLAEVTLALVLFADASRVNAHQLRADAALPIRLLGIGLPLTIGAGFAMAAGLFSGAGLWVAAALGAMVAPTDAALGAAIMEDERVPVGVRRLLNVESGLNDGIATPFVNFFLAGAASAEAVHGASSAASALVDLLGGAGIGVAVGGVGGALFSLARRLRSSAPGFEPLTALAIAMFSYSAALLASTNGFVAAFVAGMAFGTVLARSNEVLTDFVQEAGTLMSLLVWFIFGAVMLVPGINDASWRDLAFAVLALTAARMIPVTLALIGTGLDRSTVAFVGWFGPRGLASVVFALISVDTLAPADANVVLAAVTVTVALSVVLHGVTGGPFAARYGREAAQMHPERREHARAPAISTRRLMGVGGYARGQRGSA